MPTGRAVANLFSMTKAAHGSGEAFYGKRSIDPPLSKLGHQQARNVCNVDLRDMSILERRKPR